MAVEFSSTSAPVEDTGVKICVSGPAGCGKTVLAATLPGETVLISIETGLLSLQPANQQRIYGTVKEIPVFKIRNAADFKEAYELLVSKDGDDVESVAIDSLSEIAEVILAAELLKNKDGRKAYGEMQDIVTKYIRLFRDMPKKNVYFTAKQSNEMDVDGIRLYGPDMPGKKLSANLPYFFDEFFQMGISPKQPDGSRPRFLRTALDAQYYAKDRSGALAEIEEPNLSKIIAKIKQK